MSLTPVLDIFQASLFAPHRPGDSEVGSVLHGAANRFGDLGKAAHLPWGKVPEDLAGVLHLHLEPAPSVLLRSKGTLPAWVPELPQLRSLTAPAPYLHHLVQSGLLARLEVLTLTYDPEVCTGIDPALLRWPDSMGVAPLFPALRGLRLLGHHNRCQIAWESLCPWTPIAVANAFPRLQSFEADVGKSAAPFESFAQVPLLRVHADVAGNIALYPLLPTTLRHLTVTALGPKHTQDQLERLSELRTLFILGQKSPFDCARLHALPQLEELTLLDTKKFENLEMLESHPSLRSLHLVNCGRPFDKAQRARWNVWATEAPERFVGVDFC